MVKQNSVPVRAKVASTLPAALFLMVGTSLVVAGEICLEAELQQVVESALAPRPRPAPDVVVSAERDLLADVMAPVTADPPVQRAATGIRVIDGTPQRENGAVR
jgi:hypothetical protein